MILIYQGKLKLTYLIPTLFIPICLKKPNCRPHSDVQHQHPSVNEDNVKSLLLQNVSPNKTYIFAVFSCKSPRFLSKWFP